MLEHPIYIELATYPIVLNVQVSELNHLFHDHLNILIEPKCVSGTLNGYGVQYKTYHPVFQTTSADYGYLPPNVHTVPHRLRLNFYENID